MILQKYVCFAVLQNFKNRTYPFLIKDLNFKVDFLNDDCKLHYNIYTVDKSCYVLQNYKGTQFLNEYDVCPSGKKLFGGLYCNIRLLDSFKDEAIH